MSIEVLVIISVYINILAYTINSILSYLQKSGVHYLCHPAEPIAPPTTHHITHPTTHFTTRPTTHFTTRPTTHPTATHSAEPTEPTDPSINRLILLGLLLVNLNLLTRSTLIVTTVALVACFRALTSYKRSRSFKTSSAVLGSFPEDSHQEKQTI